MANPRQRRKARSGTSTKPSQTAKRHIKKKLVRAPTVKGPDVLREQWDPKKTVRQNYEALGLVSDTKLRPSGGLEPTEGTGASQSQGPQPTKGMGRIIRDEEGNVVDIVIDEDEDAEEEVTPWGKSMEGWEDKDLPSATTGSQTKSKDGSSKVVEALEAIPDHGPLPRHVSALEAHWLLSIVRKHGRDVDAMFMDKKLNELQKTKGEIRSRIKRAGGFDKIEEAIAFEDSQQ